MDKPLQMQNIRVAYLGHFFYNFQKPFQHFIYGNKFYDFPGDVADTHAIGAHLANKFQMSAKMLYLANNTFFNVDREMQFARCGSNQVQGKVHMIYK